VFKRRIKRTGRLRTNRPDATPTLVRPVRRKFGGGEALSKRTSTQEKRYSFPRTGKAS